MIDLKTTAPPAHLSSSSGDIVIAGFPPANLKMDNDWYYRWLLFPNLQNQSWQQNYSPAQKAAQQKMTLVNEGCVCGLCETRGQDVHHTPDTFPRILQALDLNKLPPSLTESELGERVGLCNKCERQIKLLEEAASIRETLKESLVSNLKHLSGINSAIHNLSDKTTPVCLNYGQAFQQCNEITPDLHSMKRKLSNWTLDSQASRRKQLKTHITHTLPISPNSLITEHINYSDEENSKVANNNPISPLSPHSSHGSYTPPLSSSKHSIDGQVLSEMTCRNRRKQARPAKAEGDVVPAVPAHIALADLRVEASSPYTALRTPTPDASLRHSRPTTPHRSATPQRSPTPQRLKTPSSQAQPQRSREPSPRLPTSASLHSPLLLPASNQQYVPTPVPAHSQLPHPVPPAAPALQPSPAHISLPTKLPTNDQPPRQLSPRPPKSLTPSSTPGMTANHQKMSYDQSKNGSSVSPFPGLPFSTSFYQNNLFNSALQSTNSTASAMLLAQSIYNAAAASKSSMLGLNNPLLFGHGMASLPGMKGMSSNSVAGSTLPFNNKANNLSSMAYNQLNGLNKKASLPSVNYSQMSGMKKPKKPSNNLLLHAKGEPTVPSFSYAPTKSSMDPAGNIGLPALKKSGMTVTPIGLGKTLQADAHTLVKTDKRRYCKVCAASCRKANNGRPPQSRFLCLACNMPMCRSCIEEHRYRIMMKVEDVPAKSASAKLLKAVKMKQDSKTPGSSVSAPYSKPPALSKPSSISSSTPPSHSSLIFGSANVTPDTDTNTSSLPAMPSLTGQPSPKPLNPLDMRIPGYKNIAPAPPKLTNMSPKLGPSPVKSEPHIPTDVELSVGVLAKDDSSEKDEEEGVLVISEQDDVDGDNPDGEISAEVASKTAAMLASIDDGDDDDSDVSLELTESDKELELNDQPSRPTSSAANSDVLQFHTPTTLSVCASPEVTSKPAGEIAVLAESIQAKALQTGSPSTGSSPVLPSIKAPEKDCVPITDSTPGIPIQKTALAV